MILSSGDATKFRESKASTEGFRFNYILIIPFNLVPVTQLYSCAP